jgi:hypothetical protein
MHRLGIGHPSVPTLVFFIGDPDAVKLVASRAGEIPIHIETTVMVALAGDFLKFVQILLHGCAQSSIIAESG